MRNKKLTIIGVTLLLLFNGGKILGQDISITCNPPTNVLTCVTASIDLTATGGVSYSWDNNLGNTANVTVAAPGSYTVTVTDADGETDTESITITAGWSIPNVLITTNPGTTDLTCATPYITLTASGGVAYIWDSGPGNDASIAVTTAGIYTVTAMAPNGCANTTSITITSAQSMPTIIVNDAEICLGDNAILMASGANVYTWTPSVGLNTTTGSSVIASSTTTTTYTVEGTHDASGCKNTATAIVYVETPNELTLSAPEWVELGEQLTIIAYTSRLDYGYFERLINDQPYQITSENSLTLQPDTGRQHFRVHTATWNLHCPSSSEIYVDVKDPYSLPSGTTDTPIEIYPNPFTNKVFFNEESLIKAYNLQGVFLQETFGNQIVICQRGTAQCV